LRLPDHVMTRARLWSASQVNPTGVECGRPFERTSVSTARWRSATNVAKAGPGSVVGSVGIGGLRSGCPSGPEDSDCLVVLHDWQWIAAASTHVCRRVMEQGGGDVGQLGDPVADVGTRGVEALGLPPSACPEGRGVPRARCCCSHRDVRVVLCHRRKGAVGTPHNTCRAVGTWSYAPRRSPLIPHF
jgi:hypothetical protein